MAADYTARNVGYGKKFKKDGKLVHYRYLNRDPKTKVLCDARTNKPVRK